MSTLDLIGRVATRRLLEERENARGRAYFCMLGLDAPIVTAIARHLAKAGETFGDVEVLVHPDLIDGDIGSAEESLKKAPYFRNRPTKGMRLTVCTAPPGHIKDVEPTLAHKSKVDDSWLLQNEMAWVEEGLNQCAGEVQQAVAKALRGMLDANVAHDTLTTARFVDRVGHHLVHDGMPPERAIRAALPALRLPRDGGDPRLHVTESRDVAARFFNRLVDEIQPALYLKARDGDPLNRSELSQRLKAMAEEQLLAADVASTLEALLADRTVHDGDWTQSQAAIAELAWETIEPFFSDAKRKPKLSFGAETKEFFDNQFPNVLSDSDAKLLDDLAKDNLKPSEDVDAFFADHRGRLQTEPRLYKRWEKLVFRPPVETSDLAEGLLRLAHRALPEGDEDGGAGRVLVVRLRKSEQMDFWRRHKNTAILRYLRDRYRGLREMLAPHAVLDFGRCWDDDWEQDIGEDENISRGKNDVELEFEGFMVASTELEELLQNPAARPHANRAQMIWKPEPNAIGLSFPLDLKHLRPAGSDAARLMTGKVRHNRASRSASVSNVNLAERTTIIDAFGESRGELANVGRAADRIDQTWPAALQNIRDQGILTEPQAEAIGDAFAAFHAAYGEAIDDLLRGAGLGSPSLIAQAERYGELLDALMAHATQELSIRDLLAPITSIGLVDVEGDSVAAIIAAWHPLRLAEIAAKAHQLASSIAQVITGNAEQLSGIEDFVSDRISVFTDTYYADVAVTNALEPTLLAETQCVADYSLLEPVSGKDHGITDEPADAAVKAFDRVGDAYIALRPHERSNFSVVILNANSENLPLAMANGLSRRIEDDPDIRCELVVTDDDPVRLRDVYERQNRRISHEIDTSLASEAARNFLSRLRVGILSPETLTSESGLKSNDIILLQDVIARSSKERWSKGELQRSTDPILTFIPTARSKRRPFRKGNTTSALYLTAPVQPAACQSYVDALRALVMRDVTLNAEPWLPIQEVEFKSGEVAELLAKAHSLGNWVMTFDRVADRRLITTDERRIVRYFSVPGSTHNVIVSTEISEAELGDRISGDLQVILPAADANEIIDVRHQLFSRAVSLSGGVVMRGAQWSNYAHELLGLVLSQREIERLLTHDRPGETGWFFLDDFRDWLDLSGEMADILAINFSVGPAGPEIRIVIAEAKYCGQDLIDHRRRSLSQLDSTWTTLNHRLCGGAANLDPSIWRHRLADMVLEHMDPFDHVGGLSQDEWLEGLRAGRFPISVDGHSLIFSHELEAFHETLPILPDQERPPKQRRRLAQWVFTRSETARALRNLGIDDATRLLDIPAGWPGENDSVDSSPPPLAPADNQSSASAVEAEEVAAEPVAAAAAPEPEVAAEAESLPAEMAERVSRGPWSAEVFDVLNRLSHAENQADGEAWLAQKIIDLRSALQIEGMEAPVLGQRLTPNTGLIYVGGKSLTVSWLERKQTDLLTRHGLDVVRITPMPGQIAIGLRRPARSILHLADAWLRRTEDHGAPQRFAPLLGEKEDDGSLCFLPLASEYAGQERAAPHSLVSGTTGSGKGILVTNLILDLCALNARQDLELYLIDPKRGVDYAWARGLPQLVGGIIDSQDDAKALLIKLVADMEERYEEIAAENCRNIDQYNRNVAPERRMPRIVIVFDEVANWMQDDDFKDVVDGLINKIATKSRAAGFHLFMVYQRADNQVMTMQLRTNLGNKLILRLGDEGSSKIALGEKGAERLLGKGHLIAKLDTDEKIYLQVPYIGDDEVEELAAAVIASWPRG